VTTLPCAVEAPAGLASQYSLGEVDNLAVDHEGGLHVGALLHAMEDRSELSN